MKCGGGAPGYPGGAAGGALQLGMGRGEERERGFRV